MSRHASPEQRRRAVLSVLSGDPVSDVARRNGVSRQTLHNWRRRYGTAGDAGLADRSQRPHASPARLDATVEALICSLREQHPDWGAQRLRAALDRLGVGKPPSRTTVHRVLVRNGFLAGPGHPATPVREASGGAARGGEPSVRAAPGEEWLEDLLGAARELVDRLDRALGVLAAEAGPDTGSCALCPPELPVDRAAAPGRPGGVRVFRTPSVSLFAQPGPHPASTMYRAGSALPRAPELARLVCSLTERAPEGRSVGSGTVRQSRSLGQ
ncbi:helix-turn-helix domain-containing protein [Streptomyces sp. NBC_00234]|uniref:helix-turn-helix domain-containing protein n=1 Tax=Streptomyces sp. NBC_00234 TaxID=2903638 RepID=UPI002E2910A5|nr:helix-turn-helix domain-containing protein [Streptomyces sp. NBC_00234]